HAAQLQLAQDETGFDGLPQTYLIRQQIADSVPAHGAVERVELVRQRHDARLDRRQQEVVLQRVEKLRRRGGVQDLIDRRLDRVERAQIARTGADDSVLTGQPHPIGGLAPDLLPVNDTAGCGMPLMPAPRADAMSAARKRHASASMRVSAWSYQSSSFSSSCSASSGTSWAMPMMVL